MKDELKELRNKIDAVDEGILGLLEERGQLTRKVGEVKSKKGLNVYDPVREQEILNRLTAKTNLPAEFVRNLFKEIIEFCRLDEKNKTAHASSTPKTASQTKAARRVAVLGPQGTFSESAAKLLYPKSNLEFQKDISEVFSFAEDGKGAGVVALENSLEGSVPKNMDALLTHKVYITGELTLDIRMCLMARKDAKKIEAILSHPHALAQCGDYLKKHYPNAKIQPTDSTTAAAKEAGKHNNWAAIAPMVAAKTYGLKILDENIQDDVSQTRFITIDNKPTIGNKTSILFTLKDKAGALHHVLGLFSDKNINLTKIESRPSRRRLGEYLFFLDFEKGPLTTKEVEALLEAVKSETTFFKKLGSY
ncbi:Prephenate dehydratase [uncultured archaeon]|nr:Prephenate dehydratase [uncultured archaeon]